MFCRIIIICRVRSSVWSTGDPCFKAIPTKDTARGVYTNPGLTLWVFVM